MSLAAALIALSGLAWLSDRWADQRARERAEQSAHQAAILRAGLLGSELQKFQLLPVVIPEYPDVTEVLQQHRPDRIARLNDTLSSLARRTDAAAIYLIDRTGMTIAASNAGSPDSFVGQNYGFRPYFKRAMQSGGAQLFALGTVSRRAGLYIAARVDHGKRPLGVLVVKVEFAALEAIWAAQPGITAVADNHGVVIIASRPDWHFRSLTPLSEPVRSIIRRTRQFGEGAGPPLDIATNGNGETRIGDHAYMASQVSVPLLDGRLINYQPLDREKRSAHALARLALGIAFAAALLVAGLVFRAHERRSLQRAARQALEQQVALRTRELTETNDQLRAESRERARADHRYRLAREELAQANRLGSIGQITAGVAHEINQPVAAIRTFAENARAFLDRGARDKVAGNIAHIVALTQRIGAITAELRAFARRGTPAIGAVQLSEVVEGTLLLIGDAVRGASIALEQVDTDTSIAVAADRIRLEQILVNLIQNAIQALETTNGPVIRIIVTGTPSIIVADNGPGIAPEIASDVFTPFVTSKPKGLGLGLGIARDIAREFGGELYIIPSPLGGAAFELRLKQA
ncbi:sensor histidine kinase [Stakelama sp. CBK3Z-3]|uniref:histidine kinase n=1 Tax=Stakelama flava TaxID=2860338 RepID=A0ABS6XN50_9SPHN|nr:ATP-binding protein [Stakelama flava]MBW4331634.1 sensor histidine kinase [Stakelama flava]